MSLPEITDVQRLRLEPGDALVVRLGEGQLTEHDAVMVKAKVQAVLGEHVPVIVVPHDMSLGVVGTQALAGMSTGPSPACEGRAPGGGPVPPGREVC